MSHVIAAVSTGAQVSAIGILRLSGDGCIEVAQQLFSGDLHRAENRKLTLGTLKDSHGRVLDQAMAVVSRAPHSYTGEDTVEFHCHGSPAVLSALLQSLYLAGARPAGRGEFTKRAFLNGKLALTQAEAVIDLIEAETADAAANAAGQVEGRLQKVITPIYDHLTDLCSHFHAVLDYPDEDIADFGLQNYAQSLRQDAKSLYALLSTYGQGRILRHGVQTAIVGRPNVGKSSLLNALAGFDRAIVTDIPGTTRDTVEESVLAGSTRLRLIDTAGIRDTQDTVEALGVDRSRKALEESDLALFVCDGSQPLTQEDREIIDLCLDAPAAIALINKGDLPQVVEPGELPFMHIIPICAATGEGLDLLKSCIDDLFAGEAPCDGSILTNPRQYDACRRAYESLLRALQGLKLGQTPDALLLDVEEAMEAMGEVTGATVREDITARIFERFCVGK